MENKQEIQWNRTLPFTASSTIKVPIVASYLINRGSNLNSGTAETISRVLGKSDNSATDIVLGGIDPNIGPLIVSENMKTIGLQSTFINGFFYLGAPPLSVQPITGQFTNRRVHRSRPVFSNNAFRNGRTAHGYLSVCAKRRRCAGGRFQIRSHRQPVSSLIWWQRTNSAR